LYASLLLSTRLAPPTKLVICLVEAVNSGGVPLELIHGETVPDWGGIGDSEDGYLAGLPGKGFALILQEIWTGIMPSSAYWNSARVNRDT